MKIDPQVKQKWVDALRSGEYQQATGKLKSQEGFCCLGVLCDLYAKEHEDAGWEYRGTDRPSDPTDYWYFEDQSEKVSLCLPVSVAQWAGIEDYDGTVHVKVLDEDYCDEDEEDVYCEVDVIDLNDNGDSFKRIADLIEESL